MNRNALICDISKQTSSYSKDSMAFKSPLITEYLGLRMESINV